MVTGDFHHGNEMDDVRGVMTCSILHKNVSHVDDDSSFFDPPFDSPLRQSTMLVAIFNLVATIVGGGVLSLPLAYDKCGLVVGTLLMIMAAMVTDYSLIMLCLTARSCNNTTGNTVAAANSYGKVGRCAFGSWMEPTIAFLLFIFLLFVLVAYLVLLRDIWSPILLSSPILPLVQKQWRSISSSRSNTETNSRTPTTITTDNATIDAIRNHDNTVLALLIIIMSPCLIQKTLHALRYNCYIGFLSISILCLAFIHHVAIKYLWNDHGCVYDDHSTMNETPTNSSTITTTMDLRLYPKMWTDVLFAFPIIMLSFLATFNVLPLQNALKHPTAQRMKFVIHAAILICFTLMTSFGIAGYLYAVQKHESTMGNILLNTVTTTTRSPTTITLNTTTTTTKMTSDEDYVFVIGRIGCGITLLLALAMMMLPCRDSILEVMEFLYHSYSCSYYHTNSKNHHSDATPSPCSLQHKEEEEQGTNDWNHETTALLSPNTTTSATCITATILSTTCTAPSTSYSSFRFTENPFLHYGMTLLIAVLCYMGAVFAPGVAIVWSLCGSTMAFLIAFILPTACYLQLQQQRRRLHQQQDDNITSACSATVFFSSWKWTYFAWCLLVSSIVGAILCTGQTVLMIWNQTPSS